MSLDRIRPMRLQDRSVVYRDLLPVIADSYPRADRWLEGRLIDVLDGRADCLIARDGQGLRAIAIQTPKGPGQLKLSTIWVAERARGRGIGARLVARCRRVWRRREIAEVWVTASPSAVDSVAALLLPRGFAIEAHSASRYKVGDVETVLRWTPQSDTERPRVSVRSPVGGVSRAFRSLSGACTRLRIADGMALHIPTYRGVDIAYGAWAFGHLGVDAVAPMASRESLALLAADR